MDLIGSMTREEMIRVEEEAQSLLRSVDLSQLTAHRGEARLDFYPAEVLGSGRRRLAKKKAELRTSHDAIGLMSELSTAKGGRPKVGTRPMVDMNAFALVTADDGDSLYYMPRILSRAKPVDIKLDNVETSVSIHVVDPNEFLTRLKQTIASSCVTTGETSGVNNLKVQGGRRSRGRPKQAPFFVHIRQMIRRTLSPNVLVVVYLLLASIWFFYRDVQFFYWLRKNRIEEMACKTCYAKGVYSFFQQSIFYLFIVISMVGYAYVAAHILRTWSGGPYPRFAAFETFRLLDDFVMAVYNYYTLPTHVRFSLTPAFFKTLVCSHFYNAFVVLLLLWNAKHNAGYRGLLRNAFGALLISFLTTSAHFYCLSALHEKLIPGVDFQYYLDAERGLVDATADQHTCVEDTTSREELEHSEL